MFLDRNQVIQSEFKSRFYCFCFLRRKESLKTLFRTDGELVCCDRETYSTLYLTSFYRQLLDICVFIYSLSASHWVCVWAHGPPSPALGISPRTSHPMPNGTTLWDKLTWMHKHTYASKQIQTYRLFKTLGSSLCCCVAVNPGELYKFEGIYKSTQQVSPLQILDISVVIEVFRKVLSFWKFINVNYFQATAS